MKEKNSKKSEKSEKSEITNEKAEKLRAELQLHKGSGFCDRNIFLNWKLFENFELIFWTFSKEF